MLWHCKVVEVEDDEDDMPGVSLQELREATQSLSTNGSANLVPKIIDRLLLEYVRKYAPLRKVLPRRTWGTNTYYFNQRTALPKAQATTEAPSATDVVASGSTYTQVGFPIKHIQSNIDIGTFAAQVATVNGSLFDLELTGAAKSLAFFEEMMHLWGSAGATNNTKRPQWDGIDMLIANSNKLDAGTSSLSLSMLDAMIDSIKGVAAQELGTDWFFMMSPRMESKITSLFVAQQRFNASLTKIFSRDDYGIPNAEVTDNYGYVDAGFEVATYRSIPIILSSFLSNQGTMTTVSATDSGALAGSQLTTQQLFYVVEAVTRNGLTAASSEVTVTPSASGHGVTLSWTTPTPLDSFGNVIDVFSYRVFRSIATGAETLYAVVPAYDANDNAVTSFVDSGIPSNINSFYTTIAASGSTAIPDGVTFPRIQSGVQNIEDIYLIPRDPEYCVIPVVNEAKTQMLAPINARTRQFALTADLTLALRAPAFAAKLGRVRSN